MFEFLRRSVEPDRQREILENILARGKRRFVLVHGVLLWGTFMFAFTNLVDLVVRHKTFDWFLPVSFVFWLVGGYGFGLSMWNRYECKYRELSGRR